MRFWPLVFVFFGSFDKGVDTEIYLIVLENGYLRMGQTPVNGGGCLLFRCEQLSIRFLNQFLLAGFPGISHLMSFGPKLMNENLSIDCYCWIRVEYTSLFSSCWIVQPQYFCSSLMIQPWKNCERAIVTSRPEEGVGTKPWKELNEIIYGIAIPKR